MTQTGPGPDTGRTGHSLFRSWIRPLAAASSAALCFAVLAFHVHLGFERIRFRVVTMPRTATEPSLQVPLPNLSRLRGAPVAVVANVRAGDQPLRVRLMLDGSPLAEAAVSAHDQIRIDAATRATRDGGHVLDVEGDGTGWRLDYLEVANVHGFSEGPVSFALVPRDRTADGVPVWVALLVSLELLALGLIGGSPASRSARLLLGLVTAPALLLFGITLVASLVTPFRILLAPSTFLLGVALIYAAPLTLGLRQLSRVLPSPRILVAYLPHAALVFVVLTGVARYYDPDTGFTSMLLFGRQFAPRITPALRDLPIAMESPFGYDGQFYAQLALDPLLRDPATATALDAAFYRARRVLVPAVAYLIGFGRTWPIVQAYALIHTAAWLALGWLLLRWLPAGRLAPTLGWIGIMASHGLLVSVQLAVPDAAAALLVASAIAALQAGRHWLAAALVALSGLAKETSLLAGAIVLPSNLPSWRRLAPVAAQAALAVAPFALWIAYLLSLDLPGNSVGARNFAWPLTAYAEKWVTSLNELRANDPFAWTSVLTMVALTAQAVYLAAVREWGNPWWRVGAGYAALMLVVGPAVWEGVPGSVTRVVLPMTLAFNVLLPRLPVRWFLPLWLLGNANLLHGPPELGLSWPW